MDDHLIDASMVNGIKTILPLFVIEHYITENMCDISEILKNLGYNETQWDEIKMGQRLLKWEECYAITLSVKHPRPEEMARIIMLRQRRFMEFILYSGYSTDEIPELITIVDRVQKGLFGAKNLNLDD